MDAEREVPLDHALVQHLSLRLAALLVALALFACARNEPAPPPLPSGPSALWVSPTGSDKASGSEATPLATVGAALAQSPVKIVLLPGAHPGTLTIDRSVTITGSDQGVALFRDHLTILADRVTMIGVNFGAGISALKAKQLVIEKARVAAGAEEDAISLGGSRARLAELELECGTETCLEIATSTVQLASVTLKAGSDTKRGLRAETSSITAQNVTISGGQVAQIQLGRWGKLSLRRGRLEGSKGNGLIGLRGSRLDAQELVVEGAALFALTFQGAQASLQKLEAKSSGSYTIGINGGSLWLDRPILERSPDGVLTIGADRGQVAKVRIEGGEIRHGDGPGVLIRDGVFAARGTVFKGALGKAQKDPADAITAAGPSARVEIDGVRFESPAGHAIALLDNAAATITATITGPGQGGIYAEDVVGSSIVIKQSRISNCLTGSGITLFECEDVSIQGVRVSGCHEAGIMAGQGTKARILKSSVQDNPLYGYAAFGNATLKIGSSSARGSKWATFSTCGEGGEIEDLGANRFIGATTRCP